MAWIEPLDLERWFINVFAGDTTIFFFVSLLIIAGLAAFFKLKNRETMLLGLLFIVIFGGYFGGIYFLVMSLTAMVIGYFIAKIVKN